MKKLIAAVACAGVASAQADFIEDLSISGSFAYESEYIFRGADLSDHSFQPGVEFGYGALGGDVYFGIWSSHEISNTDDVNTEVDFYAGYAVGLDEFIEDVPLTLDVGFTYYFYPDAGAVAPPLFPTTQVGIDRTREVYIGISADTLLSPALYYYYDFDLEQSVLELSIGHSIDLAEVADVNASLDLGAYWGFVDTGDVTGGQNDFITALFPATPTENGYSYGGISADLVYSLSENASASLGGRWAANNDGGKEDHLWFGSTISFSK